ncbi:hypothetical protein ADIS_1725 [Lunatimonas lonarensis]|uniref:DUF2281 domain-containing protein n=1 Tax=Lunatimonas lonarensis TaxID=1232681 RepID=R7ZUH7_9BACT|nr:DUF2281 domain-containing protein [Lunatimonas lonarensis]EON77806.1 hypothetical protein ADIS_1725 [Lunatimonas lonarensis]
MEIKLNIRFEELAKLANQLSLPEKQHLIAILQKTTQKSKTQKGERELGKYKGKIKMEDDFNAPLDEFKDYM